jgi:hypothetical protein
LTPPGPAPESKHPPAHEAGEPDRDLVPEERRWVWMDRWDPGTWEMPLNPTRAQKAMAGLALVIVLVMTIFVPLKILGFF